MPYAHPTEGPSRPPRPSWPVRACLGDAEDPSPHEGGASPPPAPLCAWPVAQRRLGGAIGLAGALCAAQRGRGAHRAGPLGPSEAARGPRTGPLATPGHVVPQRGARAAVSVHRAPSGATLKLSAFEFHFRGRIGVVRAQAVPRHLWATQWQPRGRGPYQVPRGALGAPLKFPRAKRRLQKLPFGGSTAAPPSRPRWFGGGADSSQRARCEAKGLARTGDGSQGGSVVNLQVRGRLDYISMRDYISLLGDLLSQPRFHISHNLT